jgi:hypothetical protein
MLDSPANLARILERQRPGDARPASDRLDPDRHDLRRHPLRFVTRSLYSDMDAFRHINDVAFR